MKSPLFTSGRLTKNMRMPFFTILICPVVINTMEHLTTQEGACIEWFESNANARKKAFTNLDKEHKTVLQERIPFDEEPQKISAALTAYTSQFYHEMKTNNETEQFPYEQAFLTNSLIKFKRGIQNNQQPFDRITARKYVLSQLTAEERATLNKKNYLNDPNQTYATIEKVGLLYAEKLAEIGIIENTPQAKKSEADTDIRATINTFFQKYN